MCIKSFPEVKRHQHLSSAQATRLHIPFFVAILQSVLAHTTVQLGLMFYRLSLAG
jgi:hypothetical protein